MFDLTGVNEASSFNLFSKLEALEKTKKVKPGKYLLFLH